LQLLHHKTTVGDLIYNFETNVELLLANLNQLLNIRYSVTGNHKMSPLRHSHIHLQKYNDIINMTYIYVSKYISNYNRSIEKLYPFLVSSLTN
jgi:hypothetical protein